MKSMKGVWMIIAVIFLFATVMVLPAAARQGYDVIDNGDIIFVYEKGLSFTGTGWAAGTPARLVHVTDNTDDDVIGIVSLSNFNVPDTAKYEGTYEVRTSGGAVLGTVIIKKVTLTIDIVNGGVRTDKLNDRTITKGTPVTFRVRSNVPEGVNNATALPYVDLRFTTPEKGTTRSFGNVDYSTVNLNNVDIYLDDTFGDSDTTNTQSGVWQAKAYWRNTGGFQDFYGEGVDSNLISFTISSGKVTLNTNKDEVVRDGGFTLTIQGRGNSNYWLYIEDAALDCNEYPWILGTQPGVTPVAASVDLDNTYAPDDVVVTGCTGNPDSTYVFKANALTTAGGSRTVEFDTNTYTNDRSYTFTVVEAPPGDSSVHDSVTVKVVKGTVSIDAEGDKVYYMGEDVKLIGENTDSEEIFLFMVGPNLCECGANIDNPTNWLEGAGCPDVAGPFFKDINVEEDNTWEFEWKTADLGLDAGTYTVYAVTTDNIGGQRTDKCGLSDAIYDQVSVTLRKPFLSAELSAPRVAKGDDLIIKGTAEGSPNDVAIWLFGTNVFIDDTETVEDDMTYEHTIDGTDTDNWNAGQFFVVVQHPMYNGILDITPEDRTFCYNAIVDSVCAESLNCTQLGYPFGTCCNMTGTNITGRFCCNTWNNISKSTCGCPDGASICAFNWISDVMEFNLEGPKSLMGSDAAEALIQSLNSPNIDDTYAKLYFLLEEAWINIDAVSDKYIGDKFTLTGTTNLAADDTFTVTVTSASFKPTEKTVSGEFSGVAGSAKVVKGTGVDNTWSFEVDTSGFKPDQYIVNVECVETATTATTTFFVSEVPPTTVPTTAPPTTAPVTTAPVTTAPVTTVPPTTTPGFGAVIALIGLGAVAVLVLRRH